MKIVCLKGGLGNQLFEYCCYKQLSEQATEPVSLYYDHRKLKQHGHLLLSDCFDVALPKPSLSVAVRTVMLKTIERCGLFPSWFDTTQAECLLYDDYCQHRRYLTKARQWLRFKKLPLSEHTMSILQQINEASFAVSVHVRRGDYLLPANARNFGSCTEAYYHKAIQHILSLHPNASFFFFSDDSEWTKHHLSFEAPTFYSETTKEPDFIDLFLMTQCSAHIIANSTFSFWGAFLSRDEKAPVVYPRQWFANPQWIVPDIFPDHWERM